MNSKDIKPWLERLQYAKPLGDVVPQAVWERAACLMEISELRHALEAAEKVIRGIAEAKRFDRAVFADADAFVDWARSLCRHHLEKP